MLYGVTVKSIKEVHIPISKIDRFQLILEPSEKWLTQIENARIEIEKEYVNNQNPDEPNPQWWHNLIKNMEYFKENF